MDRLRQILGTVAVLLVVVAVLVGAAFLVIAAFKYGDEIGQP